MIKINLDKAASIIGGTDYFHTQEWYSTGECKHTDAVAVYGPADKYGNRSMVGVTNSKNWTAKTTKAACPTKQWTTTGQ